MLTNKFRIVPGTVSKLLGDLQEKGLIQRLTLGKTERFTLFGNERGGNLVVVLTHSGDQKVEEFKTIIKLRVEAWLSRQSRTTRLAVRAAQPVAVSFARWVVKRYEPQREEILYGTPAPSTE